MTNHWPITGIHTGRLLILSRPRGGDWLADDVTAWKQDGIDTVVSLLESDEANELDLNLEEVTCESAGLHWMQLPIPDRGLPEDRRQFVSAVQKMVEQLNQGKTVGVHCRQGVGRSGMFATAVLTVLGVQPGLAIDQVSKNRGTRIPDTEQQRQWILDFARQRTAELTFAALQS